MKKRVFLLFVFFFLVSCSSPTSYNQESNDRYVQNSSPIEDASSSEANYESFLEEIPRVDSGNPIDQSSISDQIKFLELDNNQFKVVNSEQVDWPDTCLGIEQPGVNCVKEVTPGYRIILEANGLQFEYHVDKNGKQIYPATPGLSWSRDGSKKNHCDRLIIFLPDTAHACWCESGEMRSLSVNLLEILSESEYKWLIATLNNFDESTVNHSITIDTEPSLISLEFYGQGEVEPESNDQQSLIAFSQDVFTRIIPGTGSQ